MVEVLDWILMHPLAACIIGLFMIGMFGKFHLVENTYKNYYTNDNEDKEENDED